MKILEARIKRFKRFEEPGLTLSFQEDGEVLNRVLLLGDNGSGKTTALQAIGLTLNLAMRNQETFETFRWTGWAPHRLFARGEPEVEVDVQFEPDEIGATHEAFQLWYDQSPSHIQEKLIAPGDAERVTLQLRGARVWALEGAPALFQFRGRGYAAALASNPAARALFLRLPGVFWYDQFRNIAVPGEADEGPRGALGYIGGAAKLNERLVSWAIQRQRYGDKLPADYLGALERLYAALFPGRSIGPLEGVYGAEPTPISTEFTLFDGRSTYSLAEMSAGEQSIFPILFDFVRQQIHRSVVLIDELDLNLHPPLAQRLLRTLSSMGTENQFIFTSHSRTISSIVGEEEIRRLDGGALCL
jgi:hypothetical protein